MDVSSNFVSFCNGVSVPLKNVPDHPFAEFRKNVLSVCGNGCRISSFFAVPSDRGSFQLFATLLNPAQKKLLAARTSVKNNFESLSKDNPAFQLFEREIFEQYGIKPEGHPALLPVRRLRKPDEFFTMQGPAVHETAVGPVHAGVIEPGHFRFQEMGEEVYSLEISLGYQHRGLEKMLEQGPDRKTSHLIETAAGDTSASAAFCYASMLEQASGKKVSERVNVLRTIALELERIANHVGDLGALAGDVAFLPTASYCGRIRGEFLNMTALLCGNRFGRGYIVPGGTAFDLTDAEKQKLDSWLVKTRRDVEEALDLMFDTPSVLDRFENTGFLSREKALKIGVVGVAGRASGLDMDTRRDLPYGIYQNLPFSVPVKEHGDVLCRANIRLAELKVSLDIVQRLVKELPEGKAENCNPELNFLPDSLSVAVTEAWRGELCHAAVTDHNGKFRRYKITDPSFHNWFGLAIALRGQQISDFPICNKSFNLSYCGHDL